MTDYLHVTTAATSRDIASTLAESAVRARLAAGATVEGPIESYFWHDGQFGTGEEWRVLLKTTTDRYAALEAHLLAEHPWQNPEISAVSLVAGSAGCLEWIRRWTQEPAG